MISKEELARISKQTRLPLYQQEKDYLLKLFLYHYYQRYQDAIFKGGTALKYLLALERFSEDLDFNIKHPAVFKLQVQKTLQQLLLLGIRHEFIKEEIFSGSYTCEVGFEGPLFAGTKQTRNKFRIDAGQRLGTIKKPSWKLIESEYPETRERFLVLTMDFSEIMAEKVAALFQRKKGRDLYDLWFLMQAGITLDRILLAKKCPQWHQWCKMEEIITKEDYLRDLTRLSPRVIPYEQIRTEVLAWLEKLGTEKYI